MFRLLKAHEFIPLKFNAVVIIITKQKLSQFCSNKVFFFQEKIIFLPKKNSKKLVCKYPLDKSVKSVFEFQDEETIEEVASLVS